MDTRRPRFRGSIGKLTNPDVVCGGGDPRQPVEATRQKVKNSGPLYSVASRLIEPGRGRGSAKAEAARRRKASYPARTVRVPVYGLACGT